MNQNKEIMCWNCQGTGVDPIIKDPCIICYGLGYFPIEQYTCFGCAEEKTCPYAWDYYNTDGDCLYNK